MASAQHTVKSGGMKAVGDFSNNISLQHLAMVQQTVRNTVLLNYTRVHYLSSNLPSSTPTHTYCTHTKAIEYLFCVSQALYTRSSLCLPCLSFHGNRRWSLSGLRQLLHSAVLSSALMTFPSNFSSSPQV